MIDGRSSHSAAQLAPKCMHPRLRSTENSSTIADLDAVLETFAERWWRGEAPRAEEYFPGLDGDGAVALAYHEFCLHEAAGTPADPAAFLARFPAIGDRLGHLLVLHGLFDTSELRRWADSGANPAPVDLPQVGDTIGPYRLIRPLGQGGFARVFLAEQEDLEGRLVVLKVAAHDSAEPRLMARARHPYIVEILRHGVAEDGSIGWLSMPFLGGATLADLLAERRRSSSRAATGRDLLALLDRVAAPEARPTGLAHPAREILGGLSGPKAMAWIVARLAEALGHAQRVGVTHGDLKPSNILLTADGVPMLFDFNLAIDWRSPLGEGPPRESGTLAYMAPERLRALADPTRAGPITADDRHRADIYALGLVLWEALTAEPPPVPHSRARSTAEMAALLAELRGRERPIAERLARELPDGLAPILARCLADDPRDRYAHAGQLAEALDHWRADRALNHARDSPRRAGVRRWLRRRRVPIAAGLLVVLATFGAGGLVGKHLAESTTRRAMAKFERTRTDPELAGFRDLPPGRWRSIPSREAAVLADRRLRYYDARDPADWRTHADVRALPAAIREELEAWILEQALHFARAIEALGGNSDAELARALDTLEQVAITRTAGPIESRAASLRHRLGRPADVPASTPRARVPGWLDLYLYGVEAEADRPKVALAHYERSLRQKPGFYLARLKTAHLYGRLGREELDRGPFARRDAGPAPDRRGRIVAGLRTPGPTPNIPIRGHAVDLDAVPPSPIPGMILAGISNRASGRANPGAAILPAARRPVVRAIHDGDRVIVETTRGERSSRPGNPASPGGDCGTVEGRRPAFPRFRAAKKTKRLRDCRRAAPCERHK